MSAQTENLLAAETAVQDLLGTLTVMKKEVKEHADSAKVLSSAAERIDKLFDAQSRIGAGLESACEATRKVGTVEILSNLARVSETQVKTGEGLREQVEQLRKELSTMQQSLATETQNSAEKLEKMGGRLQAIALWAAGAGTVAAVGAIVALLHR